MQIIDLREEPSLIPLLAKWHHNEWAHLHPDHSLEDRVHKMDLYLSNIMVPSTFVAKENDTVIGSSALLEHDMNTNEDLSPWLASVYVHPKYRNQGIGSALVSHAMKQAKINTIQKLYLFTPDKANFYSRLGWSTLHTELYNGTNVTIMEVTLNG